MDAGETTLVATLTTAPSDAELASLAGLGVGWLEVRADLLGDLDPAPLRRRFAGRLLYTLRSRDEGGAFAGGEAERGRRLAAAAAAGYDLVDLEVERDCRTRVLAAVPPSRRLLSWHGAIGDAGELERRFADLTRHRARYYKLIPFARRLSDGLAVLRLLRAVARRDAVIFAAGDAGAWTRPLAPRFGCPLIYGSLGQVPGAPGQLSVGRLARDYGLPQLPPVERLYGIAGNPVLHSLSPRLHNGAYRALDLAALYLPFHVESFADFWLEVVESGELEDLGLPLAGLSVTAPHKEVALAVASVASPRAERVGAANTLVRADGSWAAETTDPEGASAALARAGIELAGAAAAVVGCGGAGRAAAYGLRLAGARVALVNRSEERGRAAAKELALPFVPLADFDPGRYAVVVHATSLGHRPDDPLPFDVAALAPEAAVLDLVYGEHPTPLQAAVEQRGLRFVGGREVLLFQALEQFRLMTGRALDEDLARRLLDRG
ncbi:MAG: type I 3-dehydroquinate dehydratase [Acidobacteria bacterium]|nr:MAG: type I 3-dehydroquinate dehydratase [Acidobacteriota bacterium]